MSLFGGSARSDELKNCWEIMGCGRENGGAKVHELGECLASRECMGHSCWAIAGTLCGGTVQGTIAQKRANCLACAVYRAYNRSFGELAERLLESHPDEQVRYISALKSARGRIKS